MYLTNKNKCNNHKNQISHKNVLQNTLKNKMSNFLAVI